MCSSVILPALPRHSPIADFRPASVPPDEDSLGFVPSSPTRSAVSSEISAFLLPIGDGPSSSKSNGRLGALGFLRHVFQAGEVPIVKRGNDRRNSELRPGSDYPCYFSVPSSRYHYAVLPIRHFSAFSGLF